MTEQKLIFTNLLDELPEPPAGKSGWPWTEEFRVDLSNGDNVLPRISIVTPSFNQGKFIEQTIRSVLLQNYPNLEYIIIDGGSSDETIEIIRKYDNWLSYWISEKDNGQSDAINKGLEKSTGEIFNWINSDDYYNKETFQKISDNYNSECTDLIIGNYRHFDNDNEQNEKTIDFRLRESLEETIAFVLINQPSSFFRSEIFKELGGLNENLNFVMDQDIWKKYLFKYGQDKIKIINSELTHFRLHIDSKTYMNEFNNEYMNIYYSIALQSEMINHANLIKNIYGNGFREKYTFNYDLTESNLELSKKVINSLLYYKARNAFTLENRDLFKKLIEVIQEEYLNVDQKNYLKNLKIKTKIKDFGLGQILKLWTILSNKGKVLTERNSNLDLKKGES